MYLRTLTDDELLRYASNLELTPLEAEFVRRMTDLEDEVIENEKTVEDLEAEVGKLDDELATAHEKIEALEEELIERLA
jgi:predicted  nucleic acid-binding Zn-ribbon protein